MLIMKVVRRRNNDSIQIFPEEFAIVLGGELESKAFLDLLESVLSYTTDISKFHILPFRQDWNVMDRCEPPCAYNTYPYAGHVS